MRLNGWLRIAIVMSAVWMVGATGFNWEREARKDMETARTVSNERYRCIGENGERRYRGQPEQECYSEEFVNSFYGRKNDLWIAMIAPTFWLVLAWLAGGITWLSVWWIRRGFRPS